jgi:hypothetical protein
MEWGCLRQFRPSVRNTATILAVLVATKFPEAKPVPIPRTA